MASLLDIVGVHLDDPLGEVVAVLDNHQHSLLPDELLDDCIYQLLHLLGFFHRGECALVELFAHQIVA